MAIFLLIISFSASIVGAICGIGGGVIIKPLLDLFQVGTSAEINFLSGCTVLSMSCYSVLKGKISGEKRDGGSSGTYLAVGAAIGGIVGKQLFTMIRNSAGNPSAVSFIQAVCLGIVTLFTLFYIANKSRIRTYHVTNTAACVVIGLALGMMSSFLGIGGGPINLVMLYFFFSMDTKMAATNSLYIILLSQIASLGTTVLTGTVPSFNPLSLILMVCGGIGGGIVGRALNKKMNNKAVDKLLLVLMAIIIVICIYNAYVNRIF